MMRQTHHEHTGVWTNAERVKGVLQEGVDLEADVDQHVLGSVAQAAAQAHQVTRNLAGNLLDGVLLLSLHFALLQLLQQHGKLYQHLQ